MRRLTIVGMTAALLVVAPGAAAGGGWWTSIDPEGGSHVAAGMEVTVRADAYFMTNDMREQARRGELAFHAYLIPDVDDSLLRKAMGRPFRKGWWEPQPDSIHLGVVGFEQLESSVARMSATFTVPELPPGTYSLMFCTTGCAEAVGYFVPTEVELMPSAAHASVANRADHLERRVWALRWEKRRAVRKLRKELAAEKDRFATMDGQVGELGTTMDEGLAGVRKEIRASGAQSAWPGLHAPSLLLGAIAAGCVMLLLRKSRTEDTNLENVAAEWEGPQAAPTPMR